MKRFAAKLRERAQELGLSSAEVARRAGLSERRYAHYASGRNEPDLALLVRIAEVLQTTPDRLLGLDEQPKDKSARRLLLDRLSAAGLAMRDEDLEALVAQAEAVIALRRNQSRV